MLEMDDLISRRAALEAIKTAELGCKYEAVENLPSAQPNLQPTCNQLATDSISRQAAIDALTEYGNGRAVYISVEEAFRRIEQLPSAQPEIVRCKDCKNWDTTWQNDWAKNYHYCPLIDGIRNGDWYCADAERRTE